MKETKETKETKEKKKTQKEVKEKHESKTTPGDIVFRCLIIVAIFFIAIIAYATYIGGFF